MDAGHAVETGPSRVSRTAFALVGAGTMAQMMLCAGQRGYCQCQGVGGHLADISKASVVYLLVAAHFVQGDNLYRGRIVEFRHRRVVESDMAVFTDAHEYNVDWRLCQQPA